MSLFDNILHSGALSNAVSVINDDCSCGTPEDLQPNPVVLSSRRIDTAAPLQGGGDFSMDRTHFMNPATDLEDGYLTKEDHLLLKKSGYRVIKGNASWTGSGLIFDISDTLALIGSATFTTAQTQVTLDPSDPVNPRIDVIYLKSNGTVHKLTGTASPSPIKPLVPDFSTEIELTFINIAAGATTPDGYSEVTVYDENLQSPSEWDTSTDDSDVNLADISNPYHLAKAIRMSNAGALITKRIDFFSDGAGVSTQYLKFLKFRHYLPQVGGDYLGTITLLISSIFSENQVPFVITDGTYGYNKNVVGEYQLITIPFDDTPLPAGFVKLLSFDYLSGTERYFDLITLQSLSLADPNDGCCSRMYRITSASFDMSGVPPYTKVDKPWMVGKNLAIWINEIGRYLIPPMEHVTGEWETTPTGINITLEGFDAALGTYNLFITTNLIDE